MKCCPSPKEFASAHHHDVISRHVRDFLVSHDAQVGREEDEERCVLVDVIPVFEWFWFCERMWCGVAGHRQRSVNAVQKISSPVFVRKKEEEYLRIKKCATLCRTSRDMHVYEGIGGILYDEPVVQDGGVARDSRP